MREIQVGNVKETVVERSDYPPERIRSILGGETVAVLGYGVQGRGQSLNMKDNGVKVIVGQRPGGKAWDLAAQDGWKPGETLFDLPEAAKRGTVIQYLLSDAGQKDFWPKLKPHLTKGKALYFSHGFSIVYKDQTGVVPPPDIDVILVAPKGSGTTVRRLFLEGKGINSSFAIHQDATGRAADRAKALGIAIGSGYLFETTFQKEVFSDLTGERGVLMGAIYGLWLAQYEVLRGARPLTVGGVQRNGRGGDAEPLSADRREWHGLDVRQLLDDGPARRSRLVHALPRCGQAGVRGTLQQGRRRRGDEAIAGSEQPAELSARVGKGAESGRRQRNVAGGAGGAVAKAGAGDEEVRGEWRRGDAR